jgi:hypothetical protein
LQQKRCHLVGMPTVLRVGAYRIFFYSSDGVEPPHVHVERDDNHAKYWLDPIRLAESGGFRSHELRVIAGIVQDNIEYLLRRWNEYFSE